MKKLAIVSGGQVVNVVVVPADWTGAEGEWQPPEGSSVRDGALANIGDAEADGRLQREVVLDDGAGNLERIVIDVEANRGLDAS